MGLRRCSLQSTNRASGLLVVLLEPFSMVSLEVCQCLDAALKPLNLPFDAGQGSVTGSLCGEREGAVTVALDRSRD